LTTLQKKLFFYRCWKYLSAVTNVEYSSPSTKKTSTTEQVLLANHKSERSVRHRPPESTLLVAPLII
uniref:Ovule protein n=1 Tax=Mesocestoides corti TaxID=53468 RepID=A0A5K3FNP5_MESCO